MLVLSRKTRERIVIGDPNHPLGVVEIVKIDDGNQVRLGFDFPAHVEINREEIAIRKASEGPADRPGRRPKRGRTPTAPPHPLPQPPHQPARDSRRYPANHGDVGPAEAE